MQKKLSFPLWWDDFFVDINQENLVLLNESNDANQRILIWGHEEYLGSGTIGPFGGVFCKSQTSSVVELWMDTIDRLKTKYSGKVLLCRLPTESQFPNDFIFNDSFLKKKSKIKFIDINQEISLRNGPVVNRNRKREAKAALESGLKFTVAHYKEVYDILLTNRKSKGIRFGISLDKVKKFSESPSTTFLFKITQLDEILSVAMCLKVSRSIVHVYAWGHNPDIANSQKSISLLAIEITKFFTNLGFDTLCLGISSVEGVVNHGLYNFKKTLGAYESSRIVYEIYL